WEQFKLPYTIVRPFNCVGIGERRAIRDTDVMSGNVKLALSHVVPDLVLKVLKGQDPLHILGEGTQVRHYTYGGDLAAASDSRWSCQQPSTMTSTCRPPPRQRSLSLPSASGARCIPVAARSVTSRTRHSDTTSSSGCPMSAR